MPRHGKSLRCAMMAKKPLIHETARLESHEADEIHFQQVESGGDERKWKKNQITYALLKDSKDIPGESAERIAVNLAMTTWDFEIPLELKVVKKNQNPDMKIEFVNPNLDSTFKFRSSILAYAYFPGTLKQGVIKFNENYTWTLDGKSIPSPADPSGVRRIKTYNMLHTLIHEIGHSLGLDHAQGPQSTNSVMHPTYTGQLDLSADDIKRIVKKYDAREWANQTHYNRMKKWLNYRVRRFESATFQTSEVENLKNEVKFLKKELNKKDKLLFEQLKVISSLARKLKNSSH